MAELVSDADATKLAAQARAIERFGAVLATLDGVALPADEPDALKRMKRGAALHGVMAARGCRRDDDLRTMARARPEL